MNQTTYGKPSTSSGNGICPGSNKPGVQHPTQGNYTLCPECKRYGCAKQWARAGMPEHEAPMREEIQ